MTFPRIIHQTWKDANVPDEFKAFQRSVREQNPGFEYVLWTDDDNRSLIESHYAWFLPTYDGYTHHIERVDAVRYFILLTHGGVYIDLDMECLAPIDELLSRGELCFSLEAHADCY